jgi:hypothetical protein
MIYLFVRRRPLAALAVGGLLVAQLTMLALPGLCPTMTPVECLVSALSLVTAAVGISVAVRASWLAVATAHAIRGLRTANGHDDLVPPTLAVRVRRLRCLDDPTPMAFCTGLLRPHVYVTTGALTALPQPELEAVLAHEAAHARRHDPLRKLLTRAIADVLFFFPLAGWWHRRLAETAELTADRAAIAHAGVKAVAGALLATSNGPAPTVAVSAFNSTTDARIAQLTGDHVLKPRPSTRRVLWSFLGLTAAVGLTMCLGQAYGPLLGL